MDSFDITRLGSPLDGICTLFLSTCSNCCNCWRSNICSCKWNFTISFILKVYITLICRFWDNNVALKILAAIICFILFIILVVMIAMYYNEVKFQGLFLQYSVRFLNENPLIFLYIPVFIILTFGLVVLILWQNAAFRSSSVDNTDKNLFYRLGCNFWSILNVFEFIWGLQFLRDACIKIIIYSQFLCFWKRS